LEASVESNGAAPANIYAFSKTASGQYPMREAMDATDWM